MFTCWNNCIRPIEIEHIENKNVNIKTTELKTIELKTTELKEHYLKRIPSKKNIKKNKSFDDFTKFQIPWIM